MTTLAWAQDIIGEATAVLEDLDLTPVTGTPDLAAVPSALAAGHLVITTRPPTLELPTWTEINARWELYLIAGTNTDDLGAWDALDSALFALLEPLAVDEVRPDTFTDLQGKTYPAFILTTTSHHTRSR